MQHYQIGQQIGNFTITSFNNDSANYVLTCACGNTTTGDATHVTRKISNLLSEGFTACMQCSHKLRTELETRAKQFAVIYTYKDVYREYVQKAKLRDIPFELSLDEASSLFTENCYYCGNPPQNKRTRNLGNTVYYQGLDRVDNSIGYTLNNVVPCCRYCNSFKLDRTEEEFLNHVDQIYLFKDQRPERKLVGPSGPKRKTSQAEDDMV